MIETNVFEYINVLFITLIKTILKTPTLSSFFFMNPRTLAVSKQIKVIRIHNFVV